MNQIEEAYKSNNVTEINRLNSIIMSGLDVTISESAVDFEFIESIKGKAVYKSLVKVVRGEAMGLHETLKLLSSLVTHLIIESDSKNKELRGYPIKLFSDMIEKIVVEGEIEDAKKYLRNKYGKFI